MATDSTYPVSVEGELDAELSRWLWLVKLLLLIPHFIALLPDWLTTAVDRVVGGSRHGLPSHLLAVPPPANVAGRIVV